MSKFVKWVKMLISIKEKQSFDIAFVSNCKENVTFTLGYCDISGVFIQREHLRYTSKTPPRRDWVNAMMLFLSISVNEHRKVAPANLQ